MQLPLAWTNKPCLCRHEEYFLVNETALVMVQYSKANMQNK